MADDIHWDPDLMVHRARALGHLAEDIDQNSANLEQQDPLLIEGKIIAVPILLSLATEVALKALQCLGGKKPPDKSHDLLVLFEGLGGEEKKRLGDMMPEIPSELPGLPPVYPSIRQILSEASRMFVEWRYSHEHPCLDAQTGHLKTALSAILKAYEKN